MQEIADVIMNNGFSVVLLAYFIYKDNKFNDAILQTLERINLVLAKLETWHAAEKGGE